MEICRVENSTTFLPQNEAVINNGVEEAASAGY
jgi:hypothetical protein